MQSFRWRCKSLLHKVAVNLKDDGQRCCLMNPSGTTGWGNWRAVLTLQKEKRMHNIHRMMRVGFDFMGIEGKNLIRTRRSVALVVILGLLVSAAMPVHADWNPQIGSPGMDWMVQGLALAPDGTLYAGGVFTTAGGKTVNAVALWKNGSWQALGTGIDHAVRPLTVAPDGTLYVGGDFTVAGGVPAKNIACWKNGSWQPLGTGSPKWVLALVVAPDGTLYAGGSFTSIGGTPANYVACWKNGSWQAVGTGMNAGVWALAMAPDGTLYAGGQFTTAGGTPANRVAQWKNGSWQAVGTGTNGIVKALALAPDGTLYAGGEFTVAGGVSARNIACWKNGNWQALGTGMNNIVEALAVAPDGTLYAGGWFTTAGETPANYVAHWTGSSWQALGTGVGGTTYLRVNALAVAPDGTLYAGGFFTTAGGTPSNYIAQWNSVPAAATLVSPSGTTTTAAPTYTWNAVSSATWYYLWVNGPSGNVIKQWYTAAQANCASGTGTCSVTPSTTLANGTHTWWIQTWNSAGYGPWSAGLSFTVNASPPAATLVAPSGTSCDPMPTYIWNAVSNATWYYLWVNGPSGNVLQQWYTAAQAHCGGGTGTCAIAPATTLAAGNHTWWVQTYNSVGYGPWSAEQSFTVTPGSVPGAVTLIAPSGSSANPPPYYWWYEDSCATWYYLWVNGPSGNVIKQWYSVAQAQCNGTWCWVTNATTLPAGANAWWVQTWNNAGYGSWSSGMSFTVPTSDSKAVGAVVTVRKQGPGTGTILFGGQTCGPACAELTLPYAAEARFPLQAIPAADSVFVRWETPAGVPIENTYYAQPGDIVIAIFNRR
jgi:hypothetical protein